MKLRKNKKKNNGLFTTDHNVTINGGHTHTIDFKPLDGNEPISFYTEGKYGYGGYVGDNAQYPKYDFSFTGSIPSVDPNIARIANLEKELEAAKERIRQLEKEVEEKVIVI